MTGFVDAARRHLGMGFDQVWVLSDHYFRQALGRPGPGRIEPLDGCVRFALVVVNFTTTRFLKLLLLTLVEQSALGLVHRIVIVDNGSVDGGAPFLRRLAGRSPRVELVERHLFLDHARGLRAGVSHLRTIEHDRDPSGRCNVYLFCDPDVIFRSTDALNELAATIVSADAALAGEWRGDRDDPDIQASFLAVRADAYALPDVVPPVHHGSPTMWMQRSIARAGDLPVVHFASNHGEFILHRGRSGVAGAAWTRRCGRSTAVAGTAPHYMGVPDGAGIWTAVESRQSALLETNNEPELLDLLIERFEDLGAGPANSAPRESSQPPVEREPLDRHQPLVWAPGVLQRRSLGAVLVLRPPGEPLRLSGFAPVLWAMFDQPVSPADVAAAVVDEFAVEAATASEGVVELARPLVTHGALCRAGPPQRRADPAAPPSP